MISELENTEATKSPVTVVVATRDRPELLAEALVAVGQVLRPIDSVMVVDSASRDAKVVARIVVEAGAQLVRCNRAGLSRARNAGWRAASTELVAFTDDDCLPQEGWIEALVAAFGVSPLPDFVTGRVVADSSSSGRAQLAISVTASDEPAAFTTGEDLTRVGQCGANMAWRRYALERIGGFDETLGAGSSLHSAEDYDAFWRSLGAGGAGRFDPAAVVVHRQWRGRREGLRTYRGYGVGLGALAMKRWRLEHSADAPAPVLAWHRLVRYGTREFVWRHGVAGVARNLASGYQMGALSELAVLAGALRGVLSTRRLPLVHGHFIVPN